MFKELRKLIVRGMFVAQLVASLSLTFISPHASAQSGSTTTGVWTWMGGSDTYDQPGVYGTLGTPAAGNFPGRRGGASSWTDSNGHLWLFGGWYEDNNSHFPKLNDLWEFNPSTNEWTGMAGSSTTGQPAVYGTLGTPAAGNTPWPMEGAVSWTDNKGHLWLFGGDGLLDGLWEFYPSINEWAWMGESSSASGDGVYGTLGTPSAGNFPGGRSGDLGTAASWADNNGNLWLFGGYGLGSPGNQGFLNDLWKYNIATNQWTWMAGSSTVPGSNEGQPGVYGTLGKPAVGNTPGGRGSASHWTDSNGNLWLFGGYGYDANDKQYELNDLWEFNPSTNEWTWMGGSSTPGQLGVYGTLGKSAAGNTPGAREGAVSWTDNNGHFWLFGGDHDYDDLWEFSPSTNEWAWMGGSSYENGVYGTLETPSAGNFPGGRSGYLGTSASWTDNNGNFWLFGGYGLDSTGYGGYMNDLWEFQLVPTPTITSLSPTSTTAGGAAFTLTIDGTNFVSGATVQWDTTVLTTTFVSATQLTADVPASLIATIGTASVTVTSTGAVSSAAMFTINKPVPAITSLSPSTATAGGAAFTLTINGSNFASGATVQWGTTALTTTYMSTTQLTAAVPASLIATAGTANVTVTSAGVTSSAATFGINQPVPAISSLSPSTATAGGANNHWRHIVRRNVHHQCGTDTWKLYADRHGGHCRPRRFHWQHIHGHHNPRKWLHGQREPDGHHRNQPLRCRVFAHPELWLDQSC